jgi:hypothetical protein
MLGVAAIAAGPAFGEAAAAPVLDQSYVDPPENVLAFISDPVSGFRRVQTFTAGLSGEMSVVEAVGAFEPTMTLDVLATSGGVPTDVILASAGLNSFAGNVARFDLQGLAVTAGDVLGLELVGTEVIGPWFGRDPGGYPDGGDFFLNPPAGFDAFTPSGLDMFFRVFVDVPAPAPVSLLAVGGLMLLLARRAGTATTGRRLAGEDARVA